MTMPSSPRQTVHAWLAGETRPTSAQLVRLHLVANVDERARRIRADRKAGRGIWHRLNSWLAGFESRVTASDIDQDFRSEILIFRRH